MNLSLRRSLALVLLAASAGCQNNFTESYIPTPGLAAFSRSLAPHSGKTQVIESSDLKEDSQAWVAKGYRIVGYSTFENPGWFSKSAYWSDVATQAERVSADIVLLRIRDEGVRTMKDAPSIPRGEQEESDMPYSAQLDRFSALYLRKTQ